MTSRAQPRPLRAIAALVVLAFFGAGAADGYCPMTVGRGAATGSRATGHKCCQMGLSAAATACCHAGAARNDIAVIKSGSTISPPATSVTASNLWLPSERLRVANTPVARLSHGPPPTILRI